jgi:hypothetical protein
VLAVGWLRFFTFRRGATPLRFRQLLAELCVRLPIEHVTKGLHFCNVDTCWWRWLVFRRSPPGTLVRIPAGSGVILVPGRDGKVYCAPELIEHYVSSHRYRPPKEFIEAVLALDGPGGLDWEAVERVAGKL